MAGVREEELNLKDGSVLIDLIEKVALKYGEGASNYLFKKSTKKIDPAIQFLINGINVQKIHFQNTKLKEGDVIAIIPPIGGG